MSSSKFIHLPESDSDYLTMKFGFQDGEELDWGSNFRHQQKTSHYPRIKLFVIFVVVLGVIGVMCFQSTNKIQSDIEMSNKLPDEMAYTPQETS